MPADDSSLHPLTLPDEMKKQSDNVKHLLTGRVQRVKPSAKCRKITLYVCASDSQGKKSLQVIFKLSGFGESTFCPYYIYYNNNLYTFMYVFLYRFSFRER